MSEAEVLRVILTFVVGAILGGGVTAWRGLGPIRRDLHTVTAELGKIATAVGPIVKWWNERQERRDA